MNKRYVNYIHYKYGCLLFTRRELYTIINEHCYIIYYIYLLNNTYIYMCASSIRRIILGFSFTSITTRGLGSGRDKGGGVLILDHISMSISINDSIGIWTVEEAHIV